MTYGFAFTLIEGGFSINMRELLKERVVYLVSALEPDVVQYL